MPGRLVFSTTADGAANPTERLRITSAGNVGIGTTSPTAKLEVAGGNIRFDNNQGVEWGGVNNYIYGNESTDFIAIATNGNERSRIDSSGRLLVGTSSAYGNNYLQVQGDAAAGAGTGAISLRRGAALGAMGSGSTLGLVDFAFVDGGVGAQIAGVADGAAGTNDYPGRLVFSTTADGAASPTERMRIANDGAILLGKTTVDDTTTGFAWRASQYFSAVRGAGAPGYINRLTDDGNLLEFAQDNTIEGTISVSGTTVSYNGAHLSRWSQLPSGTERTEILRGSVLSNIDEMCSWGEEDNEQLNRMKVSDVEGDKNVSGVFQAWDDDDDTYTNDFYCAMTGDFIVRIAEGVTVERGDLLMSTGDGTAKPQDDDIIRSKTIAKVTSTNVTCTYEDGSYCVPCVLMAC
jgi:hypothetical protein